MRTASLACVDEYAHGGSERRIGAWRVFAPGMSCKLTGQSGNLPTCTDITASFAKFRPAQDTVSLHPCGYLTCVREGHCRLILAVDLVALGWMGHLLALNFSGCMRTP